MKPSIETLEKLGFIIKEMPRMHSGAAHLLKVIHPSGWTSLAFSKKEIVDNLFVPLDMGGWIQYSIRLL